MCCTTDMSVPAPETAVVSETGEAHADSLSLTHTHPLHCLQYMSDRTKEGAPTAQLVVREKKKEAAATTSRT